MGKIVKHCAACDESFAERFAFCPNCGKEMTAFEMNPVAQTPVVAETPKVEEAKIEEPVIEEAKVDIPTEESSVVQPVFRSSAPTFEKTLRTDFVAPVTEVETEPVSEIVEDETPEEEPIAAKTFAASAGASNGNGNSYETTNYNRTAVAPVDDDGFHITVIEEKNGKQRNGLLLATMVITLIVVTSSTVYSLFSKDLGVGAIGDEGLFSMVVVDDVPMPIEEVPKEDKVGDEGAGGGGGGRKDNEPIGKGTIPPQLKERFVTPSNEDISVSKPSIPITRATKGDRDIIPPNRSERNGDPNSTNPNQSSGLGPDNLGMGQNGSGGFGNNGRDGRGSNGDGGVGNSFGDKYGNGNDNGGTPKPPPPPAPKPPAVTQKFRIISKPRADYTDLARQNQVTGTVTVKVTFLSSGAIGSVVPVNGLPYGLTEKAIAAAKAIKFEPATRDGVPTTTVATVQYNFNIY